MIKRMIVSAGLLAWTILFCRDAFCVEFGVDLPINSTYMWRGLELNEDPVFQPAVWAGFRGFSLTVWGNMEMTNAYNGHGEDGDSGDFTEIDYILAYAGSLHKLNYSLGYIYYDYPHTAYAGTYEFFGSISYDLFVSPALTVYRDFKEADGWYAVVSLSHEHELKKVFGSTLMASASMGYSSENHSAFYYGSGHAIFSDSQLSLGLKIPLSENISITPSIHYSALLDGAVRGRGLNKRDDTLWCGLTLAFGFEGPWD